MSIYKISLSDAQADRLADWLSRTTGEVDSRVAEEIRAQIPKAAVPEPIEFASVVRDKTGMLFVRTGALLPQPWESGDESRKWSDLDHPEVLRVGIGESAPMTEEEIDEYRRTAQRNIQKWEPVNADDGMTAGEFDQRMASGTPISAARTYTFMPSAGFDPTPAVADAYTKGVEDFATKVRREIAALRSTVVTAPEKRTCDDALALVAALLGES